MIHNAPAKHVTFRNPLACETHAMLGDSQNDHQSMHQNVLNCILN